jgi:hypothetical protein
MSNMDIDLTCYETLSDPDTDDIEMELEFEPEPVCLCLRTYGVEVSFEHNRLELIKDVFASVMEHALYVVTDMNLDMDRLNKTKQYKVPFVLHTNHVVYVFIHIYARFMTNFQGVLTRGDVVWITMTALWIAFKLDSDEDVPLDTLFNYFSIQYHKKEKLLDLEAQFTRTCEFRFFTILPDEILEDAMNALQFNESEQVFARKAMMDACMHFAFWRTPYCRMVSDVLLTHFPLRCSDIVRLFTCCKQ